MDEKDPRLINKIKTESSVKSSMAKNTEHLKKHQFQKGQSGNPGGKEKLPEEFLALRKHNKIEVGKILGKFLDMSIREVDVIAKDPESRTLEAMVARVIVEARKHGDQSRLNFLFDRTIGKVKDEVEVKLPKPTMIKLSDGSGLLLGSEKEEE